MANLPRQSKLSSSYKRNASIVRILGACILACLLFVAGFLVRGNVELLTALGFSNLNSSTTTTTTDSKSNVYVSAADRIAEVEKYLSNSIYSADLDKVSQAMLDAYSENSSDPFMHYYDEEEYASYVAGASNSTAGVGVLFSENKGKVYVADVLPGSQAEASGIRSGDVVESVDGVRKSDWTVPDVLSALNKQEGQTVYLGLQRQGDSSDVYSAALTYESSSVENVTSELDGTTAIVSVTQIGSDTASAVKTQLTDLIAAGATSVVLDLRNVPGGFLTQAVGVASLFMESGAVVQVQTSSGVTTKNTEGTTLTSLPLVVLVNDQTSGSAEVLAAALQESGRATVIGEVTQGKASVQVIQPLSFGGAIRYTAATYLTPAGRAINDNGVTPDIRISDESLQMKRAILVAGYMS